MLALVACILFVLAAFGVSNDDVNLAYLAAAVLSAHFIFAIGLPFGTRR